MDIAVHPGVRDARHKEVDAMSERPHQSLAINIMQDDNGIMLRIRAHVIDKKGTVIDFADANDLERAAYIAHVRDWLASVEQ